MDVFFLAVNVGSNFLRMKSEKKKEEQMSEMSRSRRGEKGFVRLTHTTIWVMFKHLQSIQGGTKPLRNRMEHFPRLVVPPADSCSHPAKLPLHSQAPTSHWQVCESTTWLLESVVKYVVVGKHESLSDDVICKSARS